ncbi:MAG TPA: hypothetical protein VNH80_11410 [Burkholderiales bacterium]|nr:hypothetical protein [Burkholderiales bacterium]
MVTTEGIFLLLSPGRAPGAPVLRAREQNKRREIVANPNLKDNARA